MNKPIDQKKFILLLAALILASLFMGYNIGQARGERAGYAVGFDACKNPVHTLPIKE